jgi:Domain of unknown function (DUF4062)/Ig-like domain from next to BRCA1 gene
MTRTSIRYKRVFISSTVYDLREERTLIRSLLEGFKRVPGIRFEIIASDHPDFPVSPVDRATKHSYDICLDNIARADYFILLLKQRYGDAIVEDKGDRISITHKEFREARRRKIPRFVLVDQQTWDAKQAHGRGESQSFVPSKHLPIFDFIDEIRKKTKGNWIDFFRDKADISTIISSFLGRYDDSSFVGDITIPLGHMVETGDRFTKIWEIENTGLTVWKNRSLREENPTASGLIPDTSLVPIPLTGPGERVRISVTFTAPEHPATCESYWKMVDRNGKHCFPYKVGLNCCVKVI